MTTVPGTSIFSPFYRWGNTASSLPPASPPFRKFKRFPPGCKAESLRLFFLKYATLQGKYAVSQSPAQISPASKRTEGLPSPQRPTVGQLEVLPPANVEARGKYSSLEQNRRVNGGGGRGRSTAWGCGWLTQRPGNGGRGLGRGPGREEGGRLPPTS